MNGKLYINKKRVTVNIIRLWNRNSEKRQIELVVE